MFEAYILDILTLFISIAGFGFWFMTHRLVKKRKVETGIHLEKGIVISMIVLNVILFLLYIFR